MVFAECVMDTTSKQPSSGTGNTGWNYRCTINWRTRNTAYDAYVPHGRLAGEGDITQGLTRVEELFEARARKHHQYFLKLVVLFILNIKEKTFTLPLRQKNSEKIPTN